MDELDNILHTEERPADEAPREVVLRYEAPGPQPVTERYVHSEPLPGRHRRAAAPRTAPPSAAAPPAPAEPEAPRSRKGLWIFLTCLAVVLTAALVLGVLYWRGLLTRRTPQRYQFEYEWHSGSASESSGAETTIPRWKNGDGTRLRYAEGHGAQLSIQEIYRRVNPCTVTVAATLPSGVMVIGTGVIFTPDGYILTNAHIVAGGRECYVVRDTGAGCEAKLVGYDEEKDLAVIKINAHGLPAAEFGDSDALTVGDTVYAIGNPLGVELRGTLTDGIVSAINRDVVIGGVKMTLIQTNAALNNGNSGGPLINVYGQVVGINTMKMGSNSAVSVEGLGFAIPISSSAWMVDDLIAFGEVREEPLLGVTVRQTELDDGTLELAVDKLEPDSGAERAGVQVGDRIISADGEPVDSIGDLLRIRRRHGRDETLLLELERNGVRYTCDVALDAPETEGT